MIKIGTDAWNGTLEELQARVDDFAKAKEEHSRTVGVPAPMETELIEYLWQSGDEFVLVEDEMTMIRKALIALSKKRGAPKELLDYAEMYTVNT